MHLINQIIQILGDFYTGVLSLIIVINVVVGLAVGASASAKGRSFFAWMIFTFIFGWITLLILHVAKDVDTEEDEKDV